ncbi:acyltransferase family protein [Halomonas maura]|uniref:acyltransferase family protein n=1 Tax=Halomonas maura TaxID=117606 RepID=UPI0025B28650|nr:acyltransferase family protein [Halomonas maura]MDN3555254.1 acyltransferase family protein [Halomonas maura]
MSLSYRGDIDGLRAIGVLAVVLFHASEDFLPGGYVGVDVFFVVSGYLITSLIAKEMESGNFSFLNFYKRRAARLLPALSITLAFTLLFGFVFYDNGQFDNLGKEVFFSAFGAANILFSQGVNYFAQGQAYQPLIHLWSLGVEEQFYVAWPIILIMAFKVSRNVLIPLAAVLFAFSLFLSMDAVSRGYSAGYFLPHYRAFELLVGCILALWIKYGSKTPVRKSFKKHLGVVGLLLIVVPMAWLDKNSKFPGLNALWPCIGASLVIGFPVFEGKSVSVLLSTRVLVFFGLISYPLYLYHQPIITFLNFFDHSFSDAQLLVFVLSVSSFLAWLTYRFVEISIRRSIQSEKGVKKVAIITGLVLTIPLFASSGLLVAKTNGLNNRFRYLNPFALEVAKAHGATFNSSFKRGLSINDSGGAKVLFIGDSVLQQYVVPLTRALGLGYGEVDTVTRGGCVLLKGVEFRDKFSDISCNDLREALYSIDNNYDVVVISQSWDRYDGSVTNFSESNEFFRWKPFIDETISHFSDLSKGIVIIGAHPRVSGTLEMQPSLTSTPEALSEGLKDIRITNLHHLKESFMFFSGYLDNGNVTVIHPYEIFCGNRCVVSDGHWSYFSDGLHLSSASTEYVESRLRSILANDPTPDSRL